MAALIPALIKLAMSGGFRGRGGGGGGGGRVSGGGGGSSRQPREPRAPKDPDAISMEYVDKNARKDLINPGAPVDYSKLLRDLDTEIDNLNSVLRGFGAQ